MKGITNKLGVVIALVALFGLASCSHVPVDNGGSSAGSGSGLGSSSSGGSGGGIAQGFVVQLLATSSASKASSIKNAFVNEGYNNTSVNAILRSGQTLHCVQIGPFGTQADAQRMLNQMKRRYKKNQYVNSAVVKTIYGR